MGPQEFKFKKDVTSNQEKKRMNYSLIVSRQSFVSLFIQEIFECLLLAGSLLGTGVQC